MALQDISTFVIVMMENRSFDHACGYLSLPQSGYPEKIEGLQPDPQWMARFQNDDKDGSPVPLHRLDPTVQNIIDPPHEDINIHMQINTPTHGGASPLMGGFVKSYLYATPQPTDRSPVMGYYDQQAVPIFDFFARNFAICDNWFSPLPAGTQINRLMAMSGESRIHQNVSDPLDFPEQPLVYDWLEKVRGQNSWCSYQWEGLPFFSMMPSWWPRIVADHNDPYGVGSFRRYDRFKQHWQSDEAIHDVVFIEPKYTDDPIPTPRQPNDDHCPTGIASGQKFLADIYNTIISNEEKWKSTMLIVTYDEHGGFFDHVTPPSVHAMAGGEAFTTAGVRVPSFVISPYIKPGSVFSDLVDSTSILQLLADRFTPGQGYSPAVASRQKYFKPLASILNNPFDANKPPSIQQAVLTPLASASPSATFQKGAPSPTSQALGKASTEMSRLQAW
jgi:phospholipase C